MCSPVLAASAIAMTAGTAAQSYGQNRAEKASQRNMERAQTAENQRQEKLRNERFQQLDKALAGAGVEGTEERMREAVEQRKADYQAVDDKSVESRGYRESPSPGRRGPKVVQGELDRADAETEADIEQTADARARLGSFGDSSLSRALELSPVKQKIATSGNFARGSAGVLPFEIKAAYQKGQKKGRTARTIGQVLSTAGQAGMSAGGFGAASGASLVPNMQGQAAPLMNNSSFVGMY